MVGWHWDRSFADFCCFFSPTFQSFSSLLLNQEKQYAQEALDTAVESLATNTKELTQDRAEHSLSLRVHNERNIKELQTLLFKLILYLTDT